MEDFTRDILEVTMDIFLTRGVLDEEGVNGFVADLEGDEAATALFDVFAEQARLAGFEQGYDEGYDEGVDSNTGWDEDGDDDE